MSSKFRRDGYIVKDHRGCPDYNMEFGPRYWDGPTLGCNHCGGHQDLNKHYLPPKVQLARIGEATFKDREWCSTCDAYICDWCAKARKEPGYVHLTIGQISEMIDSGKWALSGAMSKPVLTPRTILK